MSEPQRNPVTFGGWMGSMWAYTLLRIALFAALWGIAYACGLKGVLGLAAAAVVSVPLSFVLLAKPRERFAAKIEQRVNARRAEREALEGEFNDD